MAGEGGPWAPTQRQAGRRFVVTGASSGLGRETARVLAGLGAEVVLAVRDLEKGAAVARELPGTVDVRRLDVADLASVWNSMGLGSPPETVRTVRTAPTVPTPHSSTASNTTNGSTGRPPKEPCTLVRPDGRSHEAEPMPRCWACEQAAS